MSREAHVRFYESLGVGLPGATHPPGNVASVGANELRNLRLPTRTPYPLQVNGGRLEIRIADHSCPN
jgi:hypothetical protein